MRKIFLCFTLLLSLISSKSQPLRYSFALPFLSHTPLNGDLSNAFAGCVHPALLPLTQGFAVGVYTEKRFMVDDLNISRMAAMYATKNSGVGLGLNYAGSHLYNERNLSLNYGRRLGKAALGVGFSYYLFSATGYESKKDISFTASTCLRLHEKVYSGIKIAYSPSLGNEDAAAKLASVFSFLIVYAPSGKLSFSMENIKEEGLPFQVVMVVHYQPAEKYCLKLGVSTAGALPYVCLSWRQGHFNIDISASYHYVLGCSPGAAFMYQKTFAKEQ